MRVFLLRHGRTAANDSRVWTGRRDFGLSAEGAEEIKMICLRCDYPRGDIYFSSPLRRCAESMEIVYGRPADYSLPEFMECSLGSLEGKKYTNLDDDRDYISWIKNPDLSRHGGESFGQFTFRVRAGFLKMMEISERAGVKNVTAVLHGNVMRAILHGFVDVTLAHQSWKIPNCGGYLFDFEDTSSSCPGLLQYEKIPEFLF